MSQHKYNDRTDHRRRREEHQAGDIAARIVFEKAKDFRTEKAAQITDRIDRGNTRRRACAA